MTNLFIDVSSYQSDTSDFFKNIAKQNVKGACIKVTEGCQHGTNYVNPKWKNQYHNAKAVGLATSFYHFFHGSNNADSQCECRYFLNELKKENVDKNSVLVLDVESNELLNGNNLVSRCNAFFNECKRQGYNNLVTYCSRSWRQTYLSNGLTTSYLWIAEYGTSKCGVECAAWQFTDNFNGQHVDCSYDYTGFMTSGTNAQPVQNKPQSVKHTWIDELGDKWTSETGTFTLAAGQSIRLRYGARMSSTTIAILKAGDKVSYDAYCMTDGHVWIRQPRGNGKYGYLPTGETQNGKRKNYWGSFA